MVPGPQTHMATIWLGALGAVHVPKLVAVLFVQAARRTVPSMPVPRFREATVMMPPAVVETEATYLLVALADSQPQESAAVGNTGLV